MSGGLTRRQFVTGLGGVTLGTTVLGGRPGSAWAAGAPGPTGSPVGGAPAGDDTVAAQYHQLLLRHTHWAESQWDATAGHYATANFSFIVVLGNAVLLTHGDYDATAAGVDAATLKAHTLATITHFAASNVLTGGAEWGETMFFDSTFELYFVLAAKLLWSELDSTTQANVDTIAAGQADYTTALGTADDPRSPGWSPNKLLGGWQSDTKVDEMAVYAQCYGPAVAWLPQHANAATWRTWLNTWLLNDTGLPPADAANSAVVAGKPVSAWNTAHNVFDTFYVENHGSFEPHYQLETYRMSARVAAHFLTAGQPLPEALTAKPNGDQLWRTIRRVMSDSGEPFMPMDGDRYHLFGRDVIPLAFLAQVLGDEDAATAEANMAAQLGPYQLYPPEYQLTKFSGEAKYEPEARAELGISYLFHVWRNNTHGGPVRPGTNAAFHANATAATDHGTVPGLLAQNTPAAFAATVSKPGYVKCLYAPNHDDWLFDLSDASPSLLPSTTVTVQNRYAVAYSALREGFDGTAALLTLSTGHVGFTTLPTGGVVYATSGTAAGEGVLRVFNLDMPGIPGLTGSRTFTGANGAVTLAADSAGTGGTEAFTFPAVTARYVRMLGIKPGTQYGYSIYEFTVTGPGSSTNLALAKATTASSFTPAYPPADATDGDPGTRWAVAVADRTTPESWLQVDLGAATAISGATIAWEAAYGAAYAIQTSTDGSAWTDAVTVPPTHVVTGGWVNVDGRAGFVVRGSSNPVTVTANTVTLSDGPAGGAAGMVVEGHPAQGPTDTAAAAAGPAPSGGPAGLAASLADGYLSLFNLTGADLAGPLTLPTQDGEVRAYQGTQVGGRFQVSLAAANAALLPPRFAVRARDAAGLTVVVTDSQHIELTSTHGDLVTVTPLPGRQGARTVALRAGQPTALTFPGVRLTPVADLALGATTYPTSPLPAGMSTPANAVDGDPITAWRPGPSGRMVVDLGASRVLGRLTLDWRDGRVRAAVVTVSDDGLTYRSAGTVPPTARGLDLTGSARYVAVAVPGWSLGDAGLTALSISPGPSS
jgi:hypothetical protein